MAELVAVIASTHHPFYYRASTATGEDRPPFADEWVRKIEAFRETLTRARPDVLVMVGSDHFHQLWLDKSAWMHRKAAEERSPAELCATTPAHRVPRKREVPSGGAQPAVIYETDPGGQALISRATRRPYSAACSCPTFSDSSASPFSDAISGFQNAWVSSASTTCRSRPKTSARTRRR